MCITIKNWERFECKGREPKKRMDWFACPVKSGGSGKDILLDMGADGLAIFGLFILLCEEVGNQKYEDRIGGSLPVDLTLRGISRRMGVDYELVNWAVWELEKIGWITVHDKTRQDLTKNDTTEQNSTEPNKTLHHRRVSVPNGTSCRSSRTPHFDSPASKPKCDIVVESDKKAIPEPSCATSGHVPYDGDDAKCIQGESEPPSPSPDSQVDADHQVDADDAGQQPDAKSLAVLSDPPDPALALLRAIALDPKAESKRRMVNQVICAWTNYHPRSRPGAKEKRLIEARLRDGYSADDLCDAIDGIHNSPFHQGVNDASKKYLKLALVVRDSGQVDSFIALKDGPPKVIDQQEFHNAMVAEQWLAMRRESRNQTGDDDER